MVISREVTTTGIRLLTITDNHLQDHDLLKDAIKLYRAKYLEHWLSYDDDDDNRFYWERTMPNTKYVQCLISPERQVVAVTQYDIRNRMMMLAGRNGRSAMQLRDLAVADNADTWCSAAINEYAEPMWKTLLNANSPLRVISAEEEIRRRFLSGGNLADVVHTK